MDYFLDEILSVHGTLAPQKTFIVESLSALGFMAPFDLALTSVIVPLPPAIVAELIGSDHSADAAALLVALHSRCRMVVDGASALELRRFLRCLTPAPRAGPAAVAAVPAAPTAQARQHMEVKLVPLG